MTSIYNKLNTKRAIVFRMLNLAFIIVTLIFISFSQKNNSLVKEITVDGYSLEQIDEYTYQTTVANDTDELEINVVPSNENTTVEISGNEQLQEGTNIVQIKLKNDDDLKFININVTKQ